MKWSEIKVVVVDDRRPDVESLLSLLDKRGVPYNYYFEDAEPDNLPDEPLKNVRILFLDFVLGTDGQGTATKISTLLNILRRVIHKDNGPYILFLWTTNNSEDGHQINLTPYVEAAIYNEDRLPNPFAVIDIDKASTRFDLDSIEQKINQTLKEDNVFQLLIQWEALGKLAHAETLKELICLSERDMPATVTSLDDHVLFVQDQVEKHVFQFAKSVKGSERMKNDPTLLIDAQIALNGISQNYHDTNVKDTESSLLPLLRKIQSKTDCDYSLKEIARMSSYFLLSSPHSKEIQPGNIYKRGQIVKSELSQFVSFPNRVIFYDKNKYDIVKTSRGGHVDSSKFRELTQRTVQIVFEISPSCDFVQNNWVNANFVCGLLWPCEFLDGSSTKKYMQKSDRMHKTVIEYKDQPHHLVLHADYSSNIPLSMVSKVAPIFTAKKELLNDVQHWCSNHASRPGKKAF